MRLNSSERSFASRVVNSEPAITVRETRSCGSESTFLRVFKAACSQAGVILVENIAEEK